MSTPRSPRQVAILLCAYNGERFIAEQLDSLERQTYPHWRVWVSDDGSTDGTAAILATYRQRWGAHKLQVVQGPGRGFARNFLSLACRRELVEDYFAYCDQDDIWEADKLQRAVDWLEQAAPGKPALYAARTLLIDEQGAPMGFSPLFSRAPSFCNALVQNVGGGNTMVFNAPARQLLVAAGPDLDVVAHDWWTYLAVSGAGGLIRYDPIPSLRYRQHGSNLIGSNNGFGARLARVRLLMRGQLRGWIHANIAALRRIAPSLTEPNQQVLHEFLAARGRGPVARLCALRGSGVFRQTFLGNIGLIAAAFFKKL